LGAATLAVDPMTAMWDAVRRSKALVTARIGMVFLAAVGSALAAASACYIFGRVAKVVWI
jgi:hypothetical protein